MAKAEKATNAEPVKPPEPVAPPEPPAPLDGRVGFTLPFSFSLEEWQFLYAAVRDGDYWSAARYAVRILNGILNPDAKVKILRPILLDDDESAALARQMAFVQSKCAELSSAEQPTKVRSSIPGAPEFGIADVIAIIQILGPIIQRWQENRKKRREG